MRASRLIVLGLLATAGSLIEGPAAADTATAEETKPRQPALCLDVPLVDLHVDLGLGVPETCPRPPADKPAPLPAAVCLDVPLVDLRVDLGIGVPEACPRAADEEVTPPAPLPDPPPASVPDPVAVEPKPEVRPVAAPRAVSEAPVAAPPIVEPTEPTRLRTIQSSRPAMPTPPPNPFGSTVALVVVAAAVAGGTNILFRSS